MIQNISENENENEKKHLNKKMAKNQKPELKKQQSPEELEKERISNVEKNQKDWINIFNSVEPGEIENPENPQPEHSKDKNIIDIKKSESNDFRLNRNDMFTRNAIGAGENNWKLLSLAEFRNPIIAKPDSQQYDGRILFMIPYTTVKSDANLVDLYYCVIENHMSNDNEIFNFSLLSSAEIKKYFGIDLHEKSHNVLDDASEKILNHLDDLIALKERISDKTILKSVIKNIITQ